MVEVLKDEEVAATLKFYAAKAKPKKNIPVRRTQDSDKDKDIRRFKMQYHDKAITIEFFIKYTLDLYEINRKKHKNNIDCSDSDSSDNTTDEE